MENIDKGLTVPKWVLINRPKILQMPQNLSVQIVCPSQRVWDFDEKRLHWASVVRVLTAFFTMQHIVMQNMCVKAETRRTQQSRSPQWWRTVAPIGKTRQKQNRLEM